VTLIKSESVSKLFTALAKAQGELEKAVKDSANPFFKSKYADLESVIDASRPHLVANGLCIMQFHEDSDDGRVKLTTVIGHESGEYISSTGSIKPKEDTPQAVGGALTYLRRYDYAAAVGLAQKDDDGETAQGRGDTRTAKVEKPELREAQERDAVLQEISAFFAQTERSIGTAIKTIVLKGKTKAQVVAMSLDALQYAYQEMLRYAEMAEKDTPRFWEENAMVKEVVDAKL
jgi:hypothetical protein